MADLDAVAPPPAEPIPEPEPPAGDVWKLDKAGRQYVNAPHRKGVIRRRGEESIAEAIERDQRPKDQMPKASKSKAKAAMPDRPDDVDLRALEEILAEAFRSPAMIAAMVNDEYLANHFTIHGPVLARNLVKNAEVNPWLRRQLESMARGGTAAVTLMSVFGLAGAALAYLGPPIIYLFDIPVGEGARFMMQIPPSRRERAAANGRPPEAAAAA